jgi:hypothetical protein
MASTVSDKFVAVGTGRGDYAAAIRRPPVARTQRRPVPAFPTCLLSPSPTVDTKHRTLHTHGPRSCSIGHNVAKSFATENEEFVSSLFLKCFLPTQHAPIGERV